MRTPGFLNCGTNKVVSDNIDAILRYNGIVAPRVRQMDPWSGLGLLEQPWDKYDPVDVYDRAYNFVSELDDDVSGVMVDIDTISPDMAYSKWAASQVGKAGSSWRVTAFFDKDREPDPASHAVASSMFIDTLLDAASLNGNICGVWGDPYAKAMKLDDTDINNWVAARAAYRKATHLFPTVYDNVSMESLAYRTLVSLHCADAMRYPNQKIALCIRPLSPPESDTPLMPVGAEWLSEVFTAARNFSEADGVDIDIAIWESKPWGNDDVGSWNARVRTAVQDVVDAWSQVWPEESPEANPISDIDIAMGHVEAARKSLEEAKNAMIRVANLQGGSK